jgi:YHS domain-containing protein
MKALQKITLTMALILLLASCNSTKGIFASKKAKDPVCGMKVVKLNAISYDYEDYKYYFDSEKCKQIFIMNPKKFIGQ